MSSPVAASAVPPTVSAMAVGSLPGADPVLALDLFRRYTPTVLAWPQLPQRSHLEDMFLQYTEGLPGIVPGEKARVETDWDVLSPQLEDFYLRYVAAQEGDAAALATFAVSPTHAAGLHAFLEATIPPAVAELKGQVTGPLSMGLALVDRDRRAAYYNDSLKDALVKGITMKARWQAETLVAKAREAGLFLVEGASGPASGAAAGGTPSSPVIVFMDEPSLTYYGSSAFATLDRDTIASDLDECFAAIHGAGARAGIHCCANADTSLVMATATDIIHLDVYDFPETLYLYPRELAAFLERGGEISWGVVPNRAAREDVASLRRRLERIVSRLEEAGVSPSLLRPRYVSTACGLGGTDPAAAETSLTLARDLAAALGG